MSGIEAAEKHVTYTGLCKGLCQVGSSLWERKRSMRSARTSSSRKSPGNTRRERLEFSIRLADLDLTSDEVCLAGDVIAVLTSFAVLAILTCLIAAGILDQVIVALVASMVAPILARELVLSHPARLAARNADEVLKRSVEASNLMIMSLRHEPSVSKAIEFASTRNDRFSAELKACTWGVIMGRFESFEEAILNLGDKWAEYGEELKTSFNAMVTSSREATQDGRRRALDRANHAMIAGGKRRVEAYALSLSTPSMMIFGLGILLPLMVGSFLPMLSWDLWSVDGLEGEQIVQTSPRPDSQMVFIMNLLFPAVAFLIAFSAVSNHPLDVAQRPRRRRWRWSKGAVLAAAASCALVIIELELLEGSTFRSSAMLVSAVVPVSFWLFVSGGGLRGEPRDESGDMEDLLFRTGARMLEGENFESSFHRSANDPGKGSEEARRTSLRWILAGRQPGDSSRGSDGQPAGHNAAFGLRIVREAATKDEPAAGMLAMDLASYLKDLRDLENTLRNRLKPVISMMKTTALVLAPIVLGITYAIYISLTSMLGSGEQPSGPDMFFIVLGIFLAQIDAVVVYFVWGIEGKARDDRFAAAVGGYVAVSEMVFSATSLVASAR